MIIFCISLSGARGVLGSDEPIDFLDSMICFFRLADRVENDFVYVQIYLLLTSLSRFVHTI